MSEIKELLDEFFSLTSDYYTDVTCNNRMRMDASYDSIIAYVEQLEAELAAEREKYRWVSIGERFPEDNQEVYAREFSGVITHFKYSSKLAEIFRRHYTHWQPLPEPPKEGSL